MLIPFVFLVKLFVFHGPYPTKEKHPNTANKYFPCFYPTIPSTFQIKPIDVRFMAYNSTVFHSMHALAHAKYLAWLDKVQGQRRTQWEKPGIFDVT